MREGGGKQKGARFEREVCVGLSNWLTGGTQDDVFWRSAMSGGRATVSYRKGRALTNQIGDITCIDPIGIKLTNNFAIECKFYADLNYTGLLTNRGKLLEFWSEIKLQAATVRKKPMLFARQNRMPIFICFDKAGLVTINLRPDEAILINHRNDLYIMAADYFFAHCKPFTDGERKWN